MSDQPGRQGRQGIQGFQGVQGTQGEAGASTPGVEGAVGEKGPQGERGERGASAMSPQDRAVVRRTAWWRWISGVFAAVIVAVFITHHIVRDDQLESCLRVAEFRIIEARAWEQASEQRAKDGDKKTAGVYALTANSIRQTIPIKPGDKTKPRGETKISRELGCQYVFPDLIHWIG